MSDLQGTPPTIPPASNPPAAAEPGKSQMLLIVVIITVAGLIVALALIFVNRGDNKDTVAAVPPTGTGQQVQLEPIDTAIDPFAPAGDAGNDLAVTPVKTTAPTTVEGGRVGLYGGTMNKAQCDKNQLTTFLQQNPDQATAWAATQGITSADIPAYIAELTPVVLRSDTRVTNHGFKNGVANPIQSVLQAGTAVLVDSKGQPVTKCYCGNPLKPPTYAPPPPATTTTPQATTTMPTTTTTMPTTTTTAYYPPTYEGTPWPGWEPTSITIINVNVTIIEVFIIVDSETGQTFERPRGTDGNADKPVDAPPETTTTTTPATAPTTRPQTTTTRPNTTTTYYETTTTYPMPEPDCVDEFGNMVPCFGADGQDD